MAGASPSSPSASESNTGAPGLYDLAKRALESAESLGREISPVLYELQKKEEKERNIRRRQRERERLQREGECSDSTATEGEGRGSVGSAYDQLAVDYCLAMADLCYHLAHTYLRLSRPSDAVDTAKTALDYLSQCKRERGGDCDRDSDTNGHNSAVTVRLKHVYAFLAVSHSICGQIPEAEQALELMIQSTTLTGPVESK